MVCHLLFLPQKPLRFQYDSHLCYYLHPFVLSAVLLVHLEYPALVFLPEHNNNCHPPENLSVHLCFAQIMSWTTHCLKPMGFLLRRPRNLLSPQAFIRAVPALYCYFYAICLNPSSSIFFAALISLSWFVPQTGHVHSLTDRFFVSVFWYPQTEHSWLLA